MKRKSLWTPFTHWSTWWCDFRDPCANPSLRWSPTPVQKSSANYVCVPPVIFIKWEIVPLIIRMWLKRCAQTRNSKTSLKVWKSPLKLTGSSMFFTINSPFPSPKNNRGIQRSISSCFSSLNLRMISCVLNFVRLLSCLSMLKSCYQPKHNLRWCETGWKYFHPEWNYQVPSKRCVLLV